MHGYQPSKFWRVECAAKPENIVKHRMTIATITAVSS